MSQIARTGPLGLPAVVLLTAGALTAASTADAALLGRDLDGNAGNGYEAYYDTFLDIMWQTNSNLAATNTFRVDGINTYGTMTWDKAGEWISAMNVANYLGYSDWRLPTLRPVNDTTMFDTAFGNNGTTDYGYGATGIGWGEDSEMGWMYYGNLGNLGACAPTASGAGCSAQPGSDLRNLGPFQNLQRWVYWANVELTSDDAWYFHFNVGSQGVLNKSRSDFHAWAVRSGDVGAVPIPGTLWFLGSAALGLLSIARRQ